MHGLPCAGFEKIVQADAVHDQIWFEFGKKAPDHVQDVLAGVAHDAEVQDLHAKIGRQRPLELLGVGPERIDPLAVGQTVAHDHDPQAARVPRRERFPAPHPVAIENMKRRLPVVRIDARKRLEIVLLPGRRHDQRALHALDLEADLRGEFGRKRDGSRRGGDEPGQRLVRGAFQRPEHGLEKRKPDGHRCDRERHVGKAARPEPALGSAAARGHEHACQTDRRRAVRQPEQDTRSRACGHDPGQQDHQADRPSPRDPSRPAHPGGRLLDPPSAPEATRPVPGRPLP